jgi:hypothetical protein
MLNYKISERPNPEGLSCYCTKTTSKISYRNTDTSAVFPAGLLCCNISYRTAGTLLQYLQHNSGHIGPTTYKTADTLVVTYPAELQANYS